jgi:hypothetical protein
MACPPPRCPPPRCPPPRPPPSPIPPCRVPPVEYESPALADAAKKAKAAICKWKKLEPKAETSGAIVLERSLFGVGRSCRVLPTTPILPSYIVNSPHSL